MTFKIGGFNASYATNPFVESKSGATKTNEVLTTTQIAKSPPIQKQVEFTVSNCQNEFQLKRAALMAAAAHNGIASRTKQADFADAVLAEHKPNLINASKNNRAIEDRDVPGMNGRNYTYELNSQEIAALKVFRDDYAKNQQLVFANKHTINARQPNSAGTIAGVVDPNAPQTIKIRVHLPNINEPLKDRALLGYIEDKFGNQKTGLWGPNTIAIRDAAKNVGVGIKVLQTLPPNAVKPTIADIEISVSDAGKIRELAISEREKLTQNSDAANQARRDNVAQKFTEGFFNGAWADLKNNAELAYGAATDPLGAAWKIGEALVSIQNLPTKIGIGLGQAAAELAKMTPEQRQKLIDELISKGYTGLRDMPAPQAAEKAGEIVGTLAMEAVLGKGASIGLKGLAALNSTEAGAALIKQVDTLTAAAKQTILEAKVPVKITAEIIADTAGGTTPSINVEKKSFGELLNQMMSQAKDTAKSSEKLEMLKNGSTAGKEAITETAEQGLSEKAQSGMKHLKNDIPKDVMAKAKERLVTLNVGRTELIAQLDDVLNKVPNLNNSQETVANIRSAKNNLIDHLTQDDLVGALRDKFGKEVRRSGDGYIYQHSREVENGLASLENARDSMIEQLQYHERGSFEYKALSQQADALAEMIRKINSFLDIQ